MDVYDSRYFVINKLLLQACGFWPYQNPRTKLYMRAVAILMISLMILPQMLSVYKHHKNLDKIFQNLPMMFFGIAMIFKVTTFIVEEYKLKVVFDCIIENWKKITDKNERAILVEYSERGRLLTIAYSIYIFVTGTLFIVLSLTPVVFDKIMPLNASRPRIFLLNGEFLIDPHLHYAKIFLFELVTCASSTYVLIAIDTVIAVCIEHSLGLFNIVRYRLKNCTKQSLNNMERKDVSHDLIVHTIRLHNDTIRFANILETSFSLLYIILLGTNLFSISCLSILVIIKMNEAMELLKHSITLACMHVNLFFICSSGQKLIDHSHQLFRDSYNNEWYECSTKSQKTLQFLTIRTIKPCQISAGGIFVLNFENFLKVLKTSMSFMTLFSSFR